ncbi:tRNA synthetases class I, catalytic domain-containing protein [Pyronema domesticum]|uniref:glutamine--tRNA ligase n=1 Tax=Pyronema omphalodes (strain CBS 100304) TaxID=1076935 RepID=U4KYQ1_PYROM|nr:tRNA synthetases class I, catalytic domain-containing protein [Pyronema domesticum]CCX04759.1 Similar to Probable glutamine--tRNA ligase; acc. no. Q9Y7Y8 [Pyronema omphalodes CBS 100304]
MATTTSAEDTLAPLFAALGLGPKALKEATLNKKVAATWEEVLKEGGVDESTTAIDPKAGTALTELVAATAKGDGNLAGKREFVVKQILEGKIKTKPQVAEAVKYCRENKDKQVDEEFVKGFERECGVGIEFTAESLTAAVAEYIEKIKADIEEQRYKGLPATLVAIKNTALKWAPAGDLKKEIDAAYLKLLGPKDERDAPPKKAPKAAAAPAAAKEKVEEKEATQEISKDQMFVTGFLAGLHKPGGNEQIIPARMEEHLKATGGKVYTRFPPEPNGYLHIGHSKAIAINFGFARYHGGECYLRYDDTNPESEEERYIIAIREIIEWLGFKPFKITHASDHFDRLYELAEELIKKDKGYVCHCTAEEVNAQRGGKDNRGERFECKHRNRPIEESLAEFRAMRDGKYQPKEAMLRMKQDILGSGNPQMWDLTAYRVLTAPHPQTGDKWKIYPTYDFTHCLCDSFENISHSLCTTEFINSRESYDWLCNALEIYRPQQREYGRLNLTGTIMSKRKIMKLVDGGYVRGWDDPRLYTLVAIRRRGIPPGAILSFVNELGVTTTHSNIQIKRFEQTVRRYLEESVPRLMMILDPLRIRIENLPADHYEEFDAPFFKPNDTKMGTHKLPFTRIIYIDRSDFRETDSKDYFRLAPGKSVGLLKVPHTIRCTAFSKNGDGKIIEVVCHYENDVPFKKPKTYIQWIAEAPQAGSPVPVEVRQTNQLFKSENPNDNPEGFLADINPDSEEVFKDAIIENGIHEIRRRAPWPEQEGEKDKSKIGPESVRFQALRVAYFAMDSDSTEDKIVLNRIVTLKEDAGKSA